MVRSNVASQPVRVVTARQLARDASAVLDDVSENGTHVLITRHGLPVAEVYPAQASTLSAAMRVMESPEAEPSMSEDDVRELELDDTAARVLEYLLATSDLDSVIASTGLGVAAVSRAVSSLEMKRLVIREPLGVKLSRLGKQAVAAMRALADD